MIIVSKPKSILLGLSIAIVLTLATGTSANEASTVSLPKETTIFQLSLWTPYELPKRRSIVNGLRTNIFYGRHNQVKGIDIGGGNQTLESMTGLQIGFANVNKLSTGVGLGLANINQENKGFHLGVVNITQKSQDLSIAAVYNGAYERVNGVQMGLIDYARELNGIQFGVINIAHRSHGIQIGLVNHADHLFKGKQIGLLNFKENGRLMPFLRL